MLIEEQAYNVVRKVNQEVTDREVGHRKGEDVNRSEWMWVKRRKSTAFHISDVFWMLGYEYYEILSRVEYKVAGLHGKVTNQRCFGCKIPSRGKAYGTERIRIKSAKLRKNSILGIHLSANPCRRTRKNHVRRARTLEKTPRLGRRPEMPNRDSAMHGGVYKVHPVYPPAWSPQHHREPCYQPTIRPRAGVRWNCR
jgi:hypothetical protein